MYEPKIEDIKFTAYLYPVEGEADLATLKQRDEAVKHEIARAKAIIERLETYRKELFRQSQRITAAPVSLEITLLRELRYTYHGPARPFYYLTQYEVYAGVGKKKIRQEVFAGKERFQALKTLEEWKKQFPSAAVTVNIQKSKRER